MSSTICESRSGKIMKGSPIHGHIPDILFEHIWVFVLHAPSSSDVPVFMRDQPIAGFQSRDKTAMLVLKTMANYGSCFAK